MTQQDQRQELTTDPLARSTDVEAIILAAGKGTRMRQGYDGPKVMAPVSGRPMICWVVEACEQAGVRRCVLVVGYRGDEVRRAFASDDRCDFVEQVEQLGTGHAAHMAEPCFRNVPACDVLVLAGDTPLIRPRTLSRLIDTHRQSNSQVTLATAEVDDPTGYGRVIRGPDGSFDAIVEQADATAEQRAVKEINLSYYCFRSDVLFDALPRVTPKNKQGEIYLTDVPGLVKQDGGRVTVVDRVPLEEGLGVNDPQQRETAEKILQTRGGAGSGADQPVGGAG